MRSRLPIAWAIVILLALALPIPGAFAQAKPAVTLYVPLVGLGMVLLKIVESSRLSLEIQELIRRNGNEYRAR